MLQLQSLNSSLPFKIGRVLLLFHVFQVMKKYQAVIPEDPLANTKILSKAVVNILKRLSLRVVPYDIFILTPYANHLSINLLYLTPNAYILRGGNLTKAKLFRVK